MLEQIMKFDSPEPTIGDVVELMQKGFAYMDTRFDQIDAKFIEVDGRLDRIESRLEMLEERVTVIEFEVREARQRLANIEEELQGRNRACDSDTRRILALKERVERLEKKVA